MLGQFEEALAHYHYGHDKNKELCDIYFHRGLSYVSLNDYRKGLEDFTQALEKSPTPALKFKILLNMGINLRRVGNLDESIKRL